MNMLKRLSVIAAVFFLLTAFINPALAGTLYDATKAISDAKQQHSDYYQDYSGYVPGQDQGLHYIEDSILSVITDEDGYYHGVLTYGQPHGEQKDGQSRYLGYTFYGEDYTNMSFPPDRYANGADFASQNWISEPWNDPAVIASTQNFNKFPGDGDPRYHDALYFGIVVVGLLSNNGYDANPSSNPDFWNNIEQYVHILAPPTQYAWGIGRMWHYDANGSLWYVTVPIMPDILVPEPVNLKAVSLDLGVPPGQPAEPGTKYMARVVFQNESGQALKEVPVVEVRLLP